MNKLGFYIESINTPGLLEAIRDVQPPTILTHMNGLDTLRKIRRELAPNAFIIGRPPIEAQQGAYIAGRDPSKPGAPFVGFHQAGRALAQAIVHLTDPWVNARENGRLVIDAWMGLNEDLPGPASGSYRTAVANARSGDPGAQREKERIEASWRARDEFQVGFLQGLRAHNPELEAVAFNFATGNFTEPEHYLDWFPETLREHRFLGFHEYGWPSLDWAHRFGKSGAGAYRRSMTGKGRDGSVKARNIRSEYGNRHEVIITELGLGRGSNCFKACESKKHGCDIGWASRCTAPHPLQPGETPTPEEMRRRANVTQEEYFRSLEWYNHLLVEDGTFVRGACLYEVGHAGDWETFRHLGKDPEGRKIRLVEWIRRCLVDGADCTSLS